ncbi:hypothetical protein BDW22DRAFT_832759 [Trametopsis cervina]|nr:hypothetical protein BDW22DRAFT_832759 [Trametopsis cervina]
MAQSPALVIYGPIFMGMVFNVLLYGIMITQTYLYFTVYKRDKRWMKIFIGFLFLCDTLNTGFDIALVWNPLVQKYGDLTALQISDYLSSIVHRLSDPIMTAIIAIMTQMFFAWRVKVLTSNWYLVTAIAFCSIAQWCGGIGTAIAVHMVPEFAEFIKFQAIVIVWLAFSALADTLITLSLVWHLRKHKTGFTGSDDAIDRIIRLTVQTGMVTSLCAITDLILFVSVLYTNSLMSSLNSRAGWGYSNGVVRTTEGVASSSGRIGGPSSGQQVFVDVETIEMRDVDQKASNSQSSMNMYDRSFVDV